MFYYFCLCIHHGSTSSNEREIPLGSSLFLFQKNQFCSQSPENCVNIFDGKHVKQSFVLSSHSFLSGFYIALCHLFDTRQQCRRSMKRLEVVPEERTLLVSRLRSVVCTQGQRHKRRYKCAVRGWIVGTANKVQQWEFCMV